MNASRARIAQGMQRRHEQLGQPKGRTAGRIALRSNSMGKTVEKSPRIISRGKYIQYRGRVGCALTFASEAKFEIEAKISFRLEAKKKPDFT